MRLVSFDLTVGGTGAGAGAGAATPGSSRPRHRVGMQCADGSIVDLTAAGADGVGGVDASVPLMSMRDYLALGDVGAALARGAVAADAKYLVAAPSARLRAPIYDSEKVLCVGMNYVDHCTEQNVPIPTEPLIFSKMPSCIRILALPALCRHGRRDSG